MDKFEHAELLNQAGKRLGKVHGQIWQRRERGRLLDWGGHLWPENGLIGIEPGPFTLRLPDGRDAEIFVNNVLVEGQAAKRKASAATFLGSGSPP